MITLHNDCALDRLTQLPAASIDLVLTDPPYGDNQRYGRQQQTIHGDENPLVALSALVELFRLLKSDCTCFCFSSARQLPFMESFVRRYTRFTIRDVLVWDKKRIGFGQAFRKRYELILVLEKGRPQYRGRGVGNLLASTRPGRPEHPHQKPIDLLQTLIDHASDPADTVLDPFMGSGSTGLAALAAQRHFIGIELDQTYFELAKRRLAAVT